MAYTTYTTNAFICGSVHTNGADRAYLVFTELFGMVWATARSVREERSRQRYALQEFSLVRVSLIKGKGGWRIGSVMALGNPFLHAVTRGERATVVGLIQLLRRYVHGEEPLPTVWLDLKECFADDGDRLVVSAVLQPVFTLRLLYTLGYVPDEAAIQPIVFAPSLQAALKVYQPTLEAHVTRLIQHAEIVSQL